MRKQHVVKVCACVLAVWMAVSACIVASAALAYPCPEDVNCDGFVNMMDVQQLYVNVSTGEGAMTWGGTQCDMNNDGQVNMMDVLFLYARVSGDYTFAV